MTDKLLSVSKGRRTSIGGKLGSSYPGRMRSGYHGVRGARLGPRKLRTVGHVAAAQRPLSAFQGTDRKDLMASTGGGFSGLQKRVFPGTGWQIGATTKEEGYSLSGRRAK